MRFAGNLGIELASFYAQSGFMSHCSASVRGKQPADYCASAGIVENGAGL
jgi:hypothetical protein